MPDGPAAKETQTMWQHPDDADYDFNAQYDYVREAYYEPPMIDEDEPPTEADLFFAAAIAPTHGREFGPFEWEDDDDLPF